jgi:4-amino-4-deoxy-L-arabinose transferase-like glycosyltransferase
LDRPNRNRWNSEALAAGLFAALQTFFLFAHRDRFSVLLWWTGDSWPYVAALWLKDLALAAATFVIFAEVVRLTFALPEVPESDDRHSRFRHAMLLAAILAAGVALRWVAPRQIPPGVWDDAVYEAQVALRNPGAVPWFGGAPFDEGGGHPLVSHLYVKFCELIFRVFGRGDVGLLALSAVGGSLTLPAVYWLGRETGGRRVALVATALVAFAMTPLVFSRWAYIAALLLPLVLGGAAATLRAIRTGRVVWAILAGLLLGLSLHTYVAAWPIAAAFVVFALTTPQRFGRRRLVLAAGAAALVSFLPFAVAFLEYPGRLGGRARDVSFLMPSRNAALPAGSDPFAILLRLLHSVVQYTGALLWTGDPTPRNGLPGRPAFTVLVGFAALVGVALSWRRVRAGDPGHRLLLLLAVASLIAAVLSDPADAPNRLRIYPLIGISTLLAAESLVRWVPASARALPARPGLLWALGFSLLLVLETRPFFTAWPNNGFVAGSFTPAESEVGRTVRALGRAPIVLEPSALPRPLVFETLVSGVDASRPVPRLPRRSAADLLRSPPGEAFWYVCREADIEVLRRASWRCPPQRSGASASKTSVFRVAPPR